MNKPKTIHFSPDSWGEQVVADKSAMRRTIKELRKLGLDWRNCRITDCSEYDVIENHGTQLLVKRSGVRHDECHLVQPTGEGFYEVVSYNV